jgi:hypothetical protein
VETATTELNIYPYSNKERQSCAIFFEDSNVVLAVYATSPGEAHFVNLRVDNDAVSWPRNADSPITAAWPHATNESPPDITGPYQEWEDWAKGE